MRLHNTEIAAGAQTEDSRCEASFIYALRNVSEAAARGAARWIGRGLRNEGYDAALKAMRKALDDLPIAGTVVIGEGDRGHFETLFTGEQIGDGADPLQFDIAVDPVDGISYLAKGMTNALAVVAVAPRGAMANLAPAFYVEKLVVPARARGQVDPAAPVDDRLTSLARALNKDVEDLTIFVLEKPRHRHLVERIHAAGARVSLFPAGDIAGALMAATPESGIDALMGTGGASEAVIAACAIKAMGGDFYGRLDPQLPSEQIAVREAGLDTAKWLGTDDLVTGNQVFVCASGITTGLLLDGVEDQGDHEVSQSLLLDGSRRVRQLLTTFHDRPRRAGL